MSDSCFRTRTTYNVLPHKGRECNSGAHTGRTYGTGSLRLCLPLRWTGVRNSVVGGPHSFRDEGVESPVYTLTLSTFGSGLGRRGGPRDEDQDEREFRWCQVQSFSVDDSPVPGSERHLRTTPGSRRRRATHRPGQGGGGGGQTWTKGVETLPTLALVEGTPTPSDKTFSALRVPVSRRTSGSGPSFDPGPDPLGARQGDRCRVEGTSEVRTDRMTDRLGKGN